jgi:hypothetical protein
MTRTFTVPLGDASKPRSRPPVLLVDGVACPPFVQITNTGSVTVLLGRVEVGSGPGSGFGAVAPGASVTWLGSVSSAPSMPVYAATDPTGSGPGQVSVRIYRPGGSVPTPSANALSVSSGSAMSSVDVQRELASSGYPLIASPIDGVSQRTLVL